MAVELLYTVREGGSAVVGQQELEILGPPGDLRSHESQLPRVAVVLVDLDRESTRFK